MTSQNTFKSVFSFTPQLVKRVFTGLAVGLAVILFFVLRVNPNHPDWGPYWMIQPLLITPLAGAAAGFCNHILDILRTQGGAKKVLANVLAVLIYAVALWLGIVLGLNGTMWN